MTGELKRCSRCKSNILLEEYFSKNRKGEYYGTCNNCRSRHRCDKCEYRSNHKGHLKIHIKMVHDKIKDIKCELCDYKCSTNGVLTHHKKAVHDKIRDISCDKCEFKCSTNSNLTHHKKAVHDKIQDFQCDRCEFKCSTNSNLTHHKKAVHDKIKDFQCDRCEFKCSDSGTLTRHIKRVHDKIKDFQCDRCDYSCSDSSNLTRHIKMVHDKIKDFQCDMCEFKCSANEILTRHKKICTGDLNISGGELACRKALELLDIEYLTEVCELKNDDGNWLRFDFKIHIDDKPMYIEYDGEGHFKPITWGGIDEDRAIENFNKLQLHDKIKNEYCKKNNFPLLRIPYTEFENILPLIREFVNV